MATEEEIKALKELINEENQRYEYLMSLMDANPDGTGLRLTEKEFDDWKYAFKRRLEFELKLKGSLG